MWILSGMVNAAKIQQSVEKGLSSLAAPSTFRTTETGKNKSLNFLYQVN